MESFDRFDFECQIMKVWGFQEHFDSIVEGAIEANWTKDDIANVAAGLEKLFSHEMNKLWRMFEAGIASKQIL